MAYIGKTPVVGNFQICDAISVVNGQAAYTLQVGSANVIPQSANHMIVSLNGVIQKPGSSFTVSGSTMTFASNLATGDSIDFVQILGNVLDIGAPSDATVTNAKISYPLTQSGATVSTLNRTSSDGSILELQKDGTTIGSITTAGGDLLLGTNNLGIRFYDSINAVVPINIGTTGNEDNTKDLGNSGVRWKDLYLGGGAFIGGTGTSNKLDDYEEGTWTPAIKISGDTAGINYSVQAGHYTKIGNRVIASAEIALSAKGSNTGNVSMIGLPFTTSNDNYQNASVYNDRVSSPNGDVQAYIVTNATSINFYQSRTDGTNNGNLTGNEMNATSYLVMFMTYKAA
tara:strand:- start:54 stop:1079 length:1026 start_codon:yes stop_codon:yes gene_type:complete